MTRTPVLSVWPAQPLAFRIKCTSLSINVDLFRHILKHSTQPWKQNNSNLIRRSKTKDVFSDCLTILPSQVSSFFADQLHRCYFAGIQMKKAESTSGKSIQTFIPVTVPNDCRYRRNPSELEHAAYDRDFTTDLGWAALDSKLGQNLAWLDPSTEAELLLTVLLIGTSFHRVSNCVWAASDIKSG